MATAKQSYTPIPVLAGVHALAGAGKLTGLGPSQRRFRRRGHSGWTRRAAGAVDLGLAGLAIQGLSDADLRRLGGGASMLTALGSLRARRRSREGALSLVLPLLTGALGLATYLDLTLDVEP